jgi:SAM-dependent methyltransferase
MAAVTRGYGLLEGLLARQRISLANRLIPQASRTGRLLDMGCGNYPLFLFNTAFSERYGIDRLAGGACSPGDTRGVNLIDHDLERLPRLPFTDDFFDVVTMLAVFEHIELSGLPAVVTEIRRVLKPGGMFIMTTPAAWTDRILRCMAVVRLVSRVEIEEHKFAHTHGSITRVLTASGFHQDELTLGYFEAYMNIWATATKRT